MINWWNINLPDQKILDHLALAIKAKSYSTGSFTSELEYQLAKQIGFRYVILTTSGSAALLMASLAAGVNPSSKALIPNRTWIATAHAPYLLGAEIYLADTFDTHPVIDPLKVDGVSPDVIYPTSLNGCYAYSGELKKRFPHALIIEDCAQAFLSNANGVQHGFNADMACFSLGMSKFLPVGQGGFVATNNSIFAEKLLDIRSHGVSSVENRSPFLMPGFNFKPSDLLASLALAQLDILQERRNNFMRLYKNYKEVLSSNSSIHLLPVDIDNGELPIYIEVIANEPSKFRSYLASNNINVRNVYPDLDTATYLSPRSLINNLRSSRKFSNSCMVLPSGPDQPESDIDYVFSILQEYK